MQQLDIKNYNLNMKSRKFVKKLWILGILILLQLPINVVFATPKDINIYVHEKK